MAAFAARLRAWRRTTLPVPEEASFLARPAADEEAGRLRFGSCAGEEAVVPAACLTEPLVEALFGRGCSRDFMRVRRVERSGDSAQVGVILFSKI